MSNPDSVTPAPDKIVSDTGPTARPPEAWPSLPAEVRALGAILALDFLVGLWLALHTRGAITAYLAPQLPAIGLGALCWGFLPDAPKKAFGAWLARWLAAPPLYWAVILCGAGGIAASLFVSTVIIESVDPSVSTTIHIVRGTAAEADREAIAAAKDLRLNRLTTPLRKQLLIAPLGQRIWAYTPTHVSIGDPRVIPWIPTVLQYPDNFERMVVIDVLPGDLTLAKLNHADIRMVVRAEDNERAIVAQGVLHEGSTRIAFTEPPAVGPETLERWRASLRKIDSNPGFVEPMLKVWERTQWFVAQHPLRVNDRLHYELRSASNQVLLQGKLTLTNVVTPLDLSF